MNKFYRWMAKNRKLALVLFNLFFGLYAVFFCFLDFSPLIILPVYLILMFINYACIDSSPVMAMKDSLLVRNEKCDPYPMLNDTTEFMQFHYSSATELVLVLNHSASLLDIGQFQQAYDLLIHTNIDKPSSINSMRIVYYVNLFAASRNLGRTEEWRIWYEKAVQIYNDTTNQKEKQQYWTSIQSMQSDMAAAQGDYQDALRILSDMKPNTLYDQINIHMAYAEIYLKLNDPEKAKVHLQFIAQHGNRLYIAEKAHQLLSEIQS